MKELTLLCSKIPLYEFMPQCMSAANWQAFWQGVSTISIIVGGALTLFKIMHELSVANSIRKQEANLKQTEFFLNQHRRLFDDPDLSKVISHLDGDEEALTSTEMWEKKRKFLVFIEEIQLLINSKNMNKEVAYYMFGYYACCAKNGENFKIGIDTSIEHWMKFHEFCEGAEIFINELKKKAKNT